MYVYRGLKFNIQFGVQPPYLNLRELLSMTFFLRNRHLNDSSIVLTPITEDLLQKVKETTNKTYMLTGPKGTGKTRGGSRVTEGWCPIMHSCVLHENFS